MNTHQSLSASKLCEEFESCARADAFAFSRGCESIDQDDPVLIKSILKSDGGSECSLIDVVRIFSAPEFDHDLPLRKVIRAGPRNLSFLGCEPATPRGQKTHDCVNAAGGASRECFSRTIPGSGPGWLLDGTCKSVGCRP
jgi:hypothetical protein